jgi:hypothetical protein
MHRTKTGRLYVVASRRHSICERAIIAVTVVFSRRAFPYPPIHNS